MKKILLSFLICLTFSQASIMEEFFPKLDNRIIDQGSVLSIDTKKQLINILSEHEKQTSNQIIIVILNSLHGYEIEDFSYKLGRYWGIGQKEKNNGVLLLVSLKDKKIRIEVGYGLEGSLTDKISHEIIEYTLKPNFKEQNFDKGISQAINKILLAIKGEYKNEISTNYQNEINPYLFFLFFLIVFLSMLLNGVSKVIENQMMYKASKAVSSSAFISIFVISFFNLEYLAFLIFIILSLVILKITKDINFKEIKRQKSINSSNNSSSYSSKSSSRSFSGGGGSFGGGGASGGW